MYIYIYIYIYIYMYVYMVFIAQGFLEVAIESWPEWNLSDVTFSFSINVILPSVDVFLVRHSLTVFQYCLVSVTLLTSTLISRFLEKSFLVFL